MNEVELDYPIKIEDKGRNAVKGSSCGEKLKILCQKWTLINLSLFGVTFFTAGFIYYGIALNIEKFGGNIYVNVILNSIAEIIADLLAFFAV